MRRSPSTSWRCCGSHCGRSPESVRRSTPIAPVTTGRPGVPVICRRPFSVPAAVGAAMIAPSPAPSALSTTTVASSGMSATERAPAGVSEPSVSSSLIPPGCAMASPRSLSAPRGALWVTVKSIFSSASSAPLTPSLRYCSVPSAIRTWDSSTPPAAELPARPTVRGTLPGPGAGAPRLPQLKRPRSSSTSWILGPSSVRSASSTRPERSGRSRIRMRPSATVRNGPGPKAGSSATSRFRSFTVGIGNGAMASEANFTGRPSA